MVVSCAAVLGEGPVWDSNKSRLLWVDISSKHVHTYDAAGDPDTVLQLDTPMSAICPARDGRYLAATGQGLAELTFDNGLLRPLVPLPGGDRMNDAKTNTAGGSSAGRTWTVGCLMAAGSTVSIFPKRSDAPRGGNGPQRPWMEP